MMRTPAGARVVLLIYVSCVILLTLTPFKFSQALPTSFAWTGKHIDGFDLSLNVLGFLPFGILSFYVTKQSARMAWTTTIVIIVAATIVSTALELGQTLLPERSASPYDIAANGFGAALGCVTARVLSQYRPPTGVAWPRERVLISGLFCYVIALACLFLWTNTAQDLESWDPDYPLVVGNEATLTRPWLGTIFLIALYDRPLERGEIKQQFRAAHPCEAEASVYGDPLALYRFQEGNGVRVVDLAKTENPLNLEIMDPTNTAWLPGCGLVLHRPTMLKERHADGKVFRRILATNAFSVVAWVHPLNARQKGPARIVSLSLTSRIRNFTLGQEGTDIHFRVRNAISGKNGTRWALTTSNLNWSPDLTHIVATYDQGAEQLYVNGAVVARAAAIDMLALIGRALKLNLPPLWQRLTVIGLLMVPVVSGWLLFGSVSDRDIGTRGRGNYSSRS